MSDERNGDMTVVLVHGAFADAGSWAPLTEILQRAGVHVVAPALPSAASHPTPPTSAA
ncbi:hypothetical protein [Leifsonia xyli]|uniref:hypothetical protein n=1 Tax=Leifsonia xyli TaxID=1575 RepID=UPI003D663F9A